MKYKSKIYFHADDYGLTKESSERILDLIRVGAVNSLSIVPNGCPGYKADEIAAEDVPIYIHVNLVEGRSCCGLQSLLTDEKSFFKHSFTGLLKESLLHKQELKKQVYNETKAQLLRAAEAFPEGTVFGVDSHQHVHMIPAIFRAVLDAVKDSGVQIEKIRFPAEPILPFVKHPSIWFTYSPVNIVKNLLLNFLKLFNITALKKSELRSYVMCGLVFSGKMDSRIKTVYRDFKKIADKRRQDVCFVFHPGYIEESEPFLDSGKHSFNQFYLSNNRKTEYRTLKELSEDPELRKEK